MALVRLNVSVKSYKSALAETGCCGEVGICLPLDPWGTRTVTNSPFIIATVKNSGRALGNTIGVPWENPRCDDLYQYEIEYDDAQFDNDPGTGEPWILTCADIGDFLSACLVHNLIGV